MDARRRTPELPSTSPARSLRSDHEATDRGAARTPGACCTRPGKTREIPDPSTPGSDDHVHTKVHTFTATTGGALKRVEALSPRNVSQVQRVFGPDRLFPNYFCRVVLVVVVGDPRAHSSRDVLDMSAWHFTCEPGIRPRRCNAAMFPTIGTPALPKIAPGGKRVTGAVATAWRRSGRRSSTPIPA